MRIITSPLRRLLAAGLMAVLALLPVQAATGWRPASPERLLRFPADHASHPDYKTEWWYYTGHLQTSDGRAFGYELTFFREGVNRQPDRRSRWSIDHVYLAHLALTDPASRRFRFAERVNRGGLGLAGARTDRYEVWNEDWRAQSIGTSHRLKAATKDFAVDLLLDPRKPPVRHGARGYSRKGDCASCASHYYSMTRLRTRGVLTLDGKAVPVRGLSWMDHEFGSGQLQPDQSGWDWFSLQFQDGTELMLYRLRRKDGTIVPQSSGTWVDAAGRTRHLTREDVSIRPTGSWRSPVTRATYPMGWQITVPSLGLEVSLDPAMRDQELRTEGSTRVTYWEGAVTVQGQRRGRAVAGQGYVEMTGYDKPFDQRL